jgi:hypothetical protein
VPQSNLQRRTTRHHALHIGTQRADVTSSLQALRRLRTDFRDYPYPHRPYVPFRLPNSTMGNDVQSHPMQGND